MAAARAEYDSIREAARVEYRKAAALAFYAVSKGVTVSISAIQTEIINRVEASLNHAHIHDTRMQRCYCLLRHEVLNVSVQRPCREGAGR